MKGGVVSLERIIPRNGRTDQEYAAYLDGRQLPQPYQLYRLRRIQGQMNRPDLYIKRMRKFVRERVPDSPINDHVSSPDLPTITPRRRRNKTKSSPIRRKSKSKRSDMKLAIKGGKKIINQKFEIYNSIGSEEVNAAKSVVESGVLSKFLGCWDEDFYGGPKVLEFERACEKYFNVKHAITVNSWTSGLIAAVGAVDIEPGDEIITSTWTMCATATAILHWNAIPVFADIDRDTFNNNIENLRPATHQQNCFNTKSKNYQLTKNNTYRTGISAGETKLYKNFKTEQEAIDAVAEFRLKYHQF